VPAFKLGNRWRFKRSRLDEWMDRSPTSTPPMRSSTAAEEAVRRRCKAVVSFQWSVISTVTLANKAAKCRAYPDGGHSLVCVQLTGLVSMCIWHLRRQLVHFSGARRSLHCFQGILRLHS